TPPIYTLSLHDALPISDGRREDRLGAGVGERGGQRVAEPRGVLRVLEHQRRLQIDVGVQARGETEVAADERAGLLVELERPPFRSEEHTSELQSRGHLV